MAQLRATMLRQPLAADPQFRRHMDRELIDLDTGQRWSDHKVMRPHESPADTAHTLNLPGSIEAAQREMERLHSMKLLATLRCLEYGLARLVATRAPYHTLRAGVRVQIAIPSSSWSNAFVPGEAVEHSLETCARTPLAYVQPIQADMVRRPRAHDGQGGPPAKWLWRIKPDGEPALAPPDKLVVSHEKDVKSLVPAPAAHAPVPIAVPWAAAAPHPRIVRRRAKTPPVRRRYLPRPLPQPRMAVGGGDAEVPALGGAEVPGLGGGDAVGGGDAKHSGDDAPDHQLGNRRDGDDAANDDVKGPDGDVQPDDVDQLDYRHGDEDNEPDDRADDGDYEQPIGHNVVEEAQVFNINEKAKRRADARADQAARDRRERDDAKARQDFDRAWEKWRKQQAAQEAKDDRRNWLKKQSDPVVDAPDPVFNTDHAWVGDWFGRGAHWLLEIPWQYRPMIHPNHRSGLRPGTGYHPDLEWRRQRHRLLDPVFDPVPDPHRRFVELPPTQQNQLAHGVLGMLSGSGATNTSTYHPNQYLLNAEVIARPLRKGTVEYVRRGELLIALASDAVPDSSPLKLARELAQAYVDSGVAAHSRAMYAELCVAWKVARNKH
jgi:hypothetical protein